MRKAIALIVCVLAAASARAGNDDYAAMLGYLANSRIDGNALRGATGASAVNLSAGDLNQQANLRAFASGGQAQIQALQLQSDNQADRPRAASASIGGNSYVGGSGLASINQASGSGNAQLNAVSAELASQGIRETTDGALSAAVYLGNRYLHRLPPRLVERITPKSGAGPSEKARRRGHYAVETYTTTTTGARYLARFGQSCDAYLGTSVMLGESGLALALDRDRLSELRGVLTPAAAIGDALLARLPGAGVAMGTTRLI